MIMEGLRALLFGMAGIFMVMGVITGVAVLLSRLGRQADKKKSGRDQ